MECVGSAESDEVEMLTKSINISLLMADELTDDLFTAATYRSPLELHCIYPDSALCLCFKALVK